MKDARLFFSWWSHHPQIILLKWWIYTFMTFLSPLFLVSDLEPFSVCSVTDPNVCNKSASFVLIRRLALGSMPYGSPHCKMVFSLSSVLKRLSDSLRFIYDVFWNIYFGTFSEHLGGLYGEVIAQNYNVFCTNKQVETSTAMLFFLWGIGFVQAARKCVCSTGFCVVVWTAKTDPRLSCELRSVHNRRWSLRCVIVIKYAPRIKILLGMFLLLKLSKINNDQSQHLAQNTNAPLYK